MCRTTKTTDHPEAGNRETHPTLHDHLVAADADEALYARLQNDMKRTRAQRCHGVKVPY